MKINVQINYQDSIEMLEKKAAEVLASIFIKKLTPKEINELVRVLEEDLNKMS